MQWEVIEGLLSKGMTESEERCRNHSGCCVASGFQMSRSRSKETRKEALIVDQMKDDAVLDRVASGELERSS